ncbi:MAG: CPBP family intramembrane metalloprotease [Winogradskyella sp.]|uniref:CPBP family glutamic-type intramembrane protease n=1 Tax=Winogradskyella sp. TaxID=1883156 RepID=UPI0025FD0BBE|nr:CPBP family glutamic-type intramembrane protease [Winogradskyella sp.]NRB59646.1 CPBP family intramembrane metalloprotease [Winogradskyella sp.]
MKSTLIELFQYLKRPHVIKNIEKPIKSNLVKLFYLFLFTYVLKVTWLLTINSYIREKYAVERSEIADTEQQSLWVFFLLAVIVYPVVEEFIFRYHLKAKKIISLIIICLITMLSGYWLVKGFNLPSLLIKRIVLIAASIIPAALIIFIYIKKLKTKQLDTFYDKWFFIPFYMSVFAFALVHAFNFEVSGSAFLIIPFIIPMLISGMVLGYARIKYGMWANIALHVGFNLSTFILDKVFGI